MKDKTLKRFCLNDKSTLYTLKRNTEASRNLAKQPYLLPTDSKEDSSKIFSPLGRIPADLGHEILY